MKPAFKLQDWTWSLVAITALALLMSWLSFSQTQSKEIAYSDFKAAVEAREVSEVAVATDVIHGLFKESAKHPKKDLRFRTVRVEDPDLVKELAAAEVKTEGIQQSTFWGQAAMWALPLILLIVLMRRGMGAQSSALAIGRNKARLSVEAGVSDSFADVAGVDEAIEELKEVVSFLRTPDAFRRLGGRLPKGILLVGPPGTGKTLLARAVAGEASVPFFRISGSEFVELFVGVGAARVRDLFAEAKKAAPCIIFIDELDALGKVRGVGNVAHEEREQTLNQLLVELDGFDTRDGVVLMAATNRPEVLDPALLRAGRFDRHVLVDRPDKKGRLEILRIHARKVKLADEADLERLAQMTPGLVGADLANLINEAALLAVRREHDAIQLTDLEEAVERVVAGLEKKNRLLNPHERERVAIHEVGHALVAMNVPGSDAVQKISIIPRGVAALGYTMQLPAEERRLLSQPELEAKIAVLLGGRAAEDLVFGNVSTGSQDDIAKATHIARDMVKTYGMSAKLGPVRYDPEGQPIFLEAPRDGHGPFGEEVATEIDHEVLAIVQRQLHRAEQVLKDHEGVLRAASKLLLGQEVLSGSDLQRMLAESEALPVTFGSAPSNGTVTGEGVRRVAVDPRT